MRRIFGSTDDGRRGALTLSALAAIVAGVVILALALAAQHPGAPELPPQTAPLAPQSDAGAPPAEVTGSPAAVRRPLPPSRPVSISIPAIGVESKVFAIGKAADGTLAVPQPGPRLDQAAWFTNSPTPGQPGPSVIEGHVATQRGPSVFFRLGDIRRGDEVEVTREDGRVVTFTVRRMETFPKDRFPTMRVYGGRLGTPTLRLITCSDFDAEAGTHTDNLVVFTTMTRVR